MKNMKKALSAALLVPLSGGLVIVPERAAAQEGADSIPPEEIVVTAQGRTQRLQDVPISVSVTSGTELQEKNIASLQDLAAQMPNVRITSAPAADFVNVRGVGSSLNPGFEQSVATFVDGVYRARSRGTRAAIFDIDRVEILKGPQTTFFGNNAIAGALNITTRKPRQRLEANASAFYAPAFGEYAVEAGVSVPVTDTLSFRIAGRQSGMDGYLTNDFTGEKGPQQNDRIGRISLAWRPSDSFESDFRIERARMRHDEAWGAELINCPPRAPFTAAGACARYLASQGPDIDDRLDRHYAASPGAFDYDHTEAVLTNTIYAGDHSVRTITSYLDQDYGLVNEVIAVPGPQGGSPLGLPYALVLNYSERYKQFSQEIRFQSEHGRPVTYMAGLYYLNGKLSLETNQGLYLAPFGAFGAPLTNAATPIGSLLETGERVDNMSAFGSATARLSDSLRVSAGLRYTVVQKKGRRSLVYGVVSPSDTFLPSPEALTPLPLAIQQLIGVPNSAVFSNFSPPSRSDDKFMPSVNVQYDIARNVMIYASYSKGFKAGGFAMGISETSQFDPETVDAFEVGLKSRLLDNRLTLNIAAFHSKYADLQETTTINTVGGAPRQATGNVASSTAKGVEVGILFEPVDRLRISADVAYLDSRYDDYPIAPCTPLQQFTTPINCSQDLSGKRRAFAPKFSGNVAVTYTQPVGGDYQISVNGNLFMTSRYFQQPTADPDLQQPGFAKLDARIAFGPKEGRWQVAVIGRNLTDKLTANYRQFLPTAPGSSQAVADPPRSVAVQLTFNY